jgi:hypothetical protein
MPESFAKDFPETITVEAKNLTEAGENVRVGVVNNLLVVVVDLTKNLGPSSTGKMHGVGSTGGFQKLPVPGMKLNLYVGKKA